MVGRVTPNSAAIWATVCTRRPSGPVSSYMSRTILVWRAVSLAFWPPVRPRARAAARPSRVRSDMRACSKLCGDLGDGVHAPAVGAGFLVHVSDDLGLARSEFGLL